MTAGWRGDPKADTLSRGGIEYAEKHKRCISGAYHQHFDLFFYPKFKSPYKGGTMSPSRKHTVNRKYKPRVIGKSIFDGSPTLIINEYHTPNGYHRAVTDVLTAYRSGIPFNRAIDQVYALDPNHLNRNKLAEHALKTIANDY